MSQSPDTGQRILMVGCGDLGSRIARGLLQTGAEVFTLTRRRPAITGVAALLGDVGDVASIPRLPEALDALIYCLTPGARDEAAYRRAYVDGLRNVIACLPDATSVRIGFISSTAVYAAANGDWVDEASRCEPEAFNGRVLLQAEAVALERPRGMALRLGGIYGPGRDSLLRAVLAQGVMPESALAWGNRIHVDDAAAAVCHLVGRGCEGVFNIVDGAPASAAEVMDHLSTRLKLPLLQRPAHAAGGGRRVRNSRLLATGFELQYPDFRSGYDALVAARHP